MADPKAEPKAPKDGWDKADLFLKPAGGLLTALAVGFVGFYGSSVIDRSQARDTDARLYAQLMSQREQAETSLRKDMFNSIIGTFLKTKPTGYDYEQQVLNLELLAYNFHEALDLAPLFKDVYKKIAASKDENAGEYLKRLERVASEVKSKQIAGLEESGGKLDQTIVLSKMEAGSKLIEGAIYLPYEVAGGLDPRVRKTSFNVYAISSNPDKKEIRVRLEVIPDQETTAGKEALVQNTNFTVSLFDFPMIDNTRLPHGWRCAIVMRSLAEGTAEITLVYFPGSRASLKEKPFYDEAMHDLLNTRTAVDKEQR